MSLSESAGARDATAVSRGSGDRSGKRPRSEEQDGGAGKREQEHRPQREVEEQKNTQGIGVSLGPNYARRASLSEAGCFLAGRVNPSAGDEVPHWIHHPHGFITHAAAGGDVVDTTAGVEDDDHDDTEQMSAPAADTTSPSTSGIGTFSGERVVKSRRRLTLADLDTAAHESCSASTGGGRAALAVMVRRGLELLLPGDALAAERTRMFDSITEESWERELKASCSLAAPAPGSDEASDMSQHNGSESNPQSAQSMGTQQTPVLQYDTAPDASAVDSAMMTLNSSENGGSLGQSCNEPLAMPASTQPATASTAAETTGVGTVHTPQQELVAAIESLLGPSYWHCEHVAALIAAEADTSAAASQLQEQRCLCHEVQVYAEFVSVSDPPALLLLAAQKEAYRLTCVLERHAHSGSTDNPAATEAEVFAQLADERTRVATTSGSKLVDSSATPEEPTVSIWNVVENEQATFGLRAVHSVRRVMRNDPCWKAVRELLSVHGIGLRTAALIVHKQQHSSSTSDDEKTVHMETSASNAAHHGGSTGLLEKQLGLTTCQQLALNVRGHALAPRLCPQPVVAEVLRRLQAQCEAIVGDIVFQCSTTRPTADRLGLESRFTYVLVLVLSYSTAAKPGLRMQRAGQGGGNDSSVSNAKSSSIARHHLRQQVEALLRRLEEKQKCSPSAEGFAVPAATVATHNLDQAQFIIQEFAWDDDDDVASYSAAQERLHLLEAKPERLCAHVTLGSWSPLLLDLRILPTKWSSLGRAWYSMGPAHLSRRILASHGTGVGHVESAAQRASAGTGFVEHYNNSAELLAHFCDRETDQPGSTEAAGTRQAKAPVGEL